MSGQGTEGPYWVFGIATLYVVTLLFSAFRGSRALFSPMLILWHLAVTGIVVSAAARGGSAAMFPAFQRELGVAFPPWLFAMPVAVFTTLVIGWVFLDARSGGTPTAARWSRANTRKLAMSLILLVVAVGLFRAGTNYDWVTTVAIVTTIVHWFTLIESFAPAPAVMDGARAATESRGDACNGTPVV